MTYTSILVHADCRDAGAARLKCARGLADHFGARPLLRFGARPLAAGEPMRLVADMTRTARAVAGVELRPLSADADESQDYATQDLVNGMLAFHEKAAWMLRSILTTWSSNRKPALGKAS